MNKQEIIKQFEYDTKILNIRMKYSKNIFETIGLAIQYVLNTSQLSKKLSQPTPNFRGGLAIEGDGNRLEVIQPKRNNK